LSGARVKAPGKEIVTKKEPLWQALSKENLAENIFENLCWVSLTQRLAKQGLTEPVP